MLGGKNKGSSVGELQLLTTWLSLERSMKAMPCIFDMNDPVVTHFAGWLLAHMQQMYHQQVHAFNRGLWGQLTNSERIEDYFII
jgi:hypothetical protein